MCQKLIEKVFKLLKEWALPLITLGRQHPLVQQDPRQVPRVVELLVADGYGRKLDFCLGKTLVGQCQRLFAA